MAYNKYNNKKVIVDGIPFHSIKEANRYKELKLLERAGKIKDLELQPKYELIPTTKTNSGTIRKVSYYADFRYIDTQTGKEVVEDVKGYKTEVYKLKRKMLLYKYRGINFKVV